MQSQLFAPIDLSYFREAFRAFETEHDQQDSAGPLLPSLKGHYAALLLALPVEHPLHGEFRAAVERASALDLPFPVFEVAGRILSPSR